MRRMDQARSRKLALKKRAKEQRARITVALLIQKLNARRRARTKAWWEMKAQVAQPWQRKFMNRLINDDPRDLILNFGRLRINDAADAMLLVLRGDK